MPPPLSALPVVPVGKITKKYVVLQTNLTLSKMLPRFQSYYRDLGLEIINSDFTYSPLSEERLLGYVGVADAIIASTDMYELTVRVFSAKCQCIIFLPATIERGLRLESFSVKFDRRFLWGWMCC